MNQFLSGYGVKKEKKKTSVSSQFKKHTCMKFPTIHEKTNFSIYFLESSTAFPFLKFHFQYSTPEITIVNL